jgi:hypothetical protein
MEILLQLAVHRHGGKFAVPKRDPVVRDPPQIRREVGCDGWGLVARSHSSSLLLERDRSAAEVPRA